MPPKKVSEISGCNGCPMQRLFPQNNFVEPQAGDSNRIAIGEAPGQEEHFEGKPFVGGAGRVLRGLYSKAGIDINTLTLTNTLSCRPPNNDYPTDPKSRYYISKEDAEKAVQHCIHTHVKPLLEANAWERVDLIGEKALRYVAKIIGGIHKWRGSIIEIDTDKL